MGRYGVGHGALAIRSERRRRIRRSSVPGDRVLRHQPRPDNYIHFYNQYQRRKNSGVSCQSAPVKGNVDGTESNNPDLEAQLAIIPGQMPPSWEHQEENSISMEGEAPDAGPSWWPGPPLQQGGVVVPSQQERRRMSGFFSDVVSLFSGMDTWQQIQARLVPHAGQTVKPVRGESLDDEDATKANQRVSFEDEVGSGGCPPRSHLRTKSLRQVPGPPHAPPGRARCQVLTHSSSRQVSHPGLTSPPPKPGSTAHALNVYKSPCWQRTGLFRVQSLDRRLTSNWQVTDYDSQGSQEYFTTNLIN